MSLKTEAIDKVFDAGEVLAEGGGKVYANKKIDMNDLPVAINMLVESAKFLEAVKSFSQAINEAKDLDPAEQLHVITRLINLGKVYEQARKS